MVHCVSSSLLFSKKALIVKNRLSLCEGCGDCVLFASLLRLNWRESLFTVETVEVVLRYVRAGLAAFVLDSQ
jgi:hypothetical protein